VHRWLGGVTCVPKKKFGVRNYRRLGERGGKTVRINLPEANMARKASRGGKKAINRRSGRGKKKKSVLRRD